MDSLDKTRQDEILEKLNIFDLLDQPEMLLGKRQASYELDFSNIQKRQKVDVQSNSPAFYNS